ncbi:MAG: phosphohistidine phosphatase SixA [Phycisphaerales bacterium]|nr:phosphohistidine phosphatase SixA [Phycisphaerales bacterium]MCB9856614.1 phosphohistidine phosphatase SixA [Phycisphaerales bacterium]
MFVYLIRHAIAEERSPHGHADDAARRLTDRGVSRMKRNVAALDALNVELDAIWTSPLIRARETAELLIQLLRRGGRIDTVDDLAPSGNHAALLARLAASDNSDGVALVGHEPDMGEIASLLLCGEADSVMAFKKGGVACIDFNGGCDPPAGMLQWLLTPRQMRAMAPSRKASLRRSE